MRYKYRCPECITDDGYVKEYEVEKPLCEFDEPVPCPKCDKPMELAVQAVPFRI